ncbi:MAG TPA: DUF4389 domain-containing protein [Dehalococcoidia bacterium]|nr:DUF4389 domain-containing protein [Dehalococcoidia bacterium]
MTAAVIEETPEYPIRLDIARPPTQSRLLNFPLYLGTIIRLVLIIPSLLVAYYVLYASFLAAYVSMWGILFTGRYPRGLFKLVVGSLRWWTNINSYIASLFDEYPPMDLDQRPDVPLNFEVDYSARPSRWLNLPFFPIKLILIIPHLVILFFVSIVAGIVGFIAAFAILFTGSYPAGLHAFVVGYQRWCVRVIGYLVALTDKYPPFSLS